MEDSWSVCPYCQRTGFGAGGAPQATRVEEASKAVPSAAPAVGRKTVVLTDKRKPPVVGWFVALTGDQKGEDFRIHEGQNVIGSAPDADIVLRDTTISGKHASLRYKDQKFFLTDLDSTNGTFLNDSRDPIAREELKDNDVVRIGEVSVKFKCF
jgi:hypothetical protein